MADITERLRELSKARWDKDAWERETTVRIPAEPDRDIDLVLANAAAEIDRLRARVAYMDQQRTGLAVGLDVRDEKIDLLRARVAELEAIRRLVLFETSEDADGYMPHHPREALFVLRSAANSTAPPAPRVDVDAISDGEIFRGVEALVTRNITADLVDTADMRAALRAIFNKGE